MFTKTIGVYAENFKGLNNGVSRKLYILKSRIKLYEIRRLIKIPGHRTFPRCKLLAVASVARADSTLHLEIYFCRSCVVYFLIVFFFT